MGTLRLMSLQKTLKKHCPKPCALLICIWNRWFVVRKTEPPHDMLEYMWTPRAKPWESLALCLTLVAFSHWSPSESFTGFLRYPDDPGSEITVGWSTLTLQEQLRHVAFSAVLFGAQALRNSPMNLSPQREMRKTLFTVTDKSHVRNGNSLCSVKKELDFFFFSNWRIADVQYYINYWCTIQWFMIFKGYMPLIVIIKFLPYSPHCTMCLCSLFYT